MLRSVALPLRSAARPTLAREAMRKFLREGASSPGPICNRLVGLKNEAWPEGFLSGRVGRAAIMTRAAGERVRGLTGVRQLEQTQRAVVGKASTEPRIRRWVSLMAGDERPASLQPQDLPPCLLLARDARPVRQDQCAILFGRSILSATGSISGRRALHSGRRLLEQGP